MQLKLALLQQVTIQGHNASPVLVYQENFRFRVNDRLYLYNDNEPDMVGQVLSIRNVMHTSHDGHQAVLLETTVVNAYEDSITYPKDVSFVIPTHHKELVHFTPQDNEVLAYGNGKSNIAYWVMHFQKAPDWCRDNLFLFGVGSGVMGRVDAINGTAVRVAVPRTNSNVFIPAKTPIIVIK